MNPNNKDYLENLYRNPNNEDYLENLYRNPNNEDYFENLSRNPSNEDFLENTGILTMRIILKILYRNPNNEDYFENLQILYLPLSSKNYCQKENSKLIFFTLMFSVYSSKKVKIVFNLKKKICF